MLALVLAAGTIAAGGRGLSTLSTYIPAYLRSGLHLPTLTAGALLTLIMPASIAGRWPAACSPTGSAVPGR